FGAEALRVIDNFHHRIEFRSAERDPAQRLGTGIRSAVRQESRIWMSVTDGQKDSCRFGDHRTGWQTQCWYLSCRIDRRIFCAQLRIAADIYFDSVIFRASFRECAL